MTTVKHAIGEHDYVELLEPAGKWPAGTDGAVVSDYGAMKLVEISDSRGEMLDLIQIHESRLKLLTRHSQ